MPNRIFTAKHLEGKEKKNDNLKNDNFYVNFLQGDLPFPSPQHMTPEAVAQAMKVLEIHEKLEHPDNPGDSDEPADRMGDNEVEVLKEMCNVSVYCVPPCACWFPAR